MDTTTSCSTEETRRVAGELATHLDGSSTVLLRGDIGAGKTEFVRGLVMALGGADEVSSPTFTLINEYRLPDGVLYHADLYRCETEADVVSSGLEEFLGEGICVIEWPGRLGALMPREFWDVHIEIEVGDSRLITIRKQIS